MNWLFLCYEARLPISTALKDVDRVLVWNIRSAYENMHLYLYVRISDLHREKKKERKNVTNRADVVLTVAHFKTRKVDRTLASFFMQFEWASYQNGRYICNRFSYVSFTYCRNISNFCTECIATHSHLLMFVDVDLWDRCTFLSRKM